MTLCNFIFTSLGLFLLTQCNTRRDNNSATQILLPSTKIQSESQLTGEWTYSYSIWYSSELTLQDNGTFKFHDQSCHGQMFSQGKWTNDNGIIQLTSFDAFKPKEQTDTIRSAEVTEHSFVGLKDIPPPVLPGPDDTVRVYLDKIQLQLKNDTLYCIGSHQLPEETKFHRAKSNR